MQGERPGMFKNVTLALAPHWTRTVKMRTKETAMHIGTRNRPLAALAALLFSCGATPKPATAPQSPPEPLSSETAAAPSNRSVSDAEPTVETEWLAILIDGHKSGYLKSSRAVFPDRVETEVTTSMVLRRAGVPLPIVTVSKMVETPDGTPLRIEKQTRGAGTEQEETGVIGADGNLHLTTRSAGRTTSRTTDWPKGALMAEGQRLEALRYGLAPGTHYTSTYFDPDLLEAIAVDVSVGERRPANLFGRAVEGTAVHLRMSLRGAVSELDMVVDDQLNTLSTASMRMGMKVEMIACTEQYALSENDPAEMIEAAFIDAPTPLTTQRRQRPITYVVRAGETDILSTDQQTTVRKGETQRVTVSPSVFPADATMPYGGNDEEALAALKPTVWIESDAEEIRTLAETAAAGATTAADAARNIEHFVGAYIRQKDFSVGYATALETLRSRQGDCTEHALLTAALCRAVGIPAEVVFGLVYVEQFNHRKHLFGGHAWTRAFLNGKWVSLDAALGGFDTGHIALAVSNGNPADFFQIMDLIGSLKIDAVK